MKKQMIAVVVMAAWLIAGIGPAQSAEKDKLVFGAIAVGKVSQVRKTLQPLIDHLQKATGAEISFETGKDYMDTIEKFRSGYFDFGYIGPSPYIIATESELGIDNFKMIGGLETKGKPYYHAVIVADKDNEAINGLEDIKGKKFAFGSRQSTLSCYMPCKMLIQAGVFDTLAGYEFRGKHDIVVRDVALGKFDAGGVKESVAASSLKKIKIIAKSDPVYDFLLIAHKDMDPDQFQKIKDAVLNLKDPDILDAIKPGVTGFIETTDANYDSLRKIMAEVDQKLGSGQ